MKKSEKLLGIILPIVTVIAILITWSIASVSVNSEYILPSVTETFRALINVFSEKAFYVALLGTFLRSLIAFIISFVVAFILAVLSFKKFAFSKIVGPIVGILRALPTIAVVLLLLLWTNSKIAPIIVTLLVVLPTVYTSVLNSLQSVDKTVCEAARVDGANEKRVFALIELPIIKPDVYSVIGSGFSLNFKLMVAAEVIAQTARSLGLMLNVAKAYYETAEMFALVCVSVIVGLVVESIFNKLSQRARK